MNSLQGKTIVVTGASSGIGREVARQCAFAGGKVYAVARRVERLDALARDCSEAKGRLYPFAGDLSDAQFASRLTNEVSAIDILINVAGISKNAPFLKSDPAFWSSLFETNVVATMRITQAVAQQMAARSQGHIVVVTSVLARAVYKYTLAYAASKHALAAFTQGLRGELFPYNIKVTEVAPGLVGGTEFLDGVDSEEVKESYKLRPYKPITASDVADAVLSACCTAANVEHNLIEIKPVGQP
jgi:NADP-dependent 3-hydroxy acid dehydrogenase YdfG